MKDKSFLCICAYFNPANYKTPIKNYREFAERLRKQGVPLLTIELSFTNTFCLPEIEPVGKELGACHIKLSRPNAAVMWQKERLMNFASQVMLSSFNSKADKLCLLDCDLLFKDDNWADNTAKAIETYDVVQPFGWLHRLGSQKEELFTQRGAVASISHGEYSPNCGGGAWAFRRDFLDRVGWYDKSPVGGNDTILLNSLFSVPQPHFNTFMSASQYAYASKVLRYKPSVGYIDNEVCHLYHGSFENRFYGDRYSILIENHFDPDSDIKLSDGVYQWSTEKSLMHDEVKRYFLSRREDS